MGNIVMDASEIEVGNAFVIGNFVGNKNAF